MKAASTSITAGWRLGESRATCSSARMPPIRTASSAQPSCSSAWAQRPLTCPARDSARLRTVTTSAPVASSPAPTASTRPRAASRAAGGRGCRAGPASWCASQPQAGPSTRAAAGASPPAAIPPGVHRRPRRRAAHHFITGKTLGEHVRLRGPFRRNAGTQVCGVLHARARRGRDQGGAHRRSVYPAAATYVFAAFTAGRGRSPPTAVIPCPTRRSGREGRGSSGSLRPSIKNDPCGRCRGTGPVADLSVKRVGFFVPGCRPAAGPIQPS